MIRGITVTLYERTLAGVDAFNAPVYEETPVSVENVLVGEPSTEDITTSTDLYGKRIRYMLGIPKGDTHDWEDKRVEWTDAYGRMVRVRTFGFPITGIEANIPGPWHMKVRCEERMVGRDDVCYLVAEDPQAHGIFDKPEEKPRMVYCSVLSIGQNESYRALDHKLHPTILFKLKDAIDYRGEKIVLWTPPHCAEQKRYGVVRTYGAGDGFEIYCEEATVDARKT